MNVGSDEKQEDQKQYVTDKLCTSSDVGHYKRCDWEDQGYGMPFQKGGPYVEAFNQNINSNYSGLVTRMGKFLDFCMPPILKDNREIFVHALCAIIANDTSIDDNQEFLIGPSGEAVKKSTILEMKEICFESFITGVWHFCLYHRARMNRQGKKTYNWLFNKPEPEDNTNPNYRSIPLREDFVTNAKREIKVINLEAALKAAEQVLNNVYAEKKSDGSLDVAKFIQDSQRSGDSAGAEKVEAEFADEKESEKASASAKWGNVTYIESQINQGTNGKVFNIGNTGNVELHFGKDS